MLFPDGHLSRMFFMKLKICKLCSTLSKSLLNRYLGFLLFLFAYTMIMERFGGLPSVLTAWRFEIPLLLYLYYYCNLITRKSRFQFLVAAIPVFLLYGVFDVYHLLLGRLLRITEVSELQELFQVMPLKTKRLIFLFLGLPMIGFLVSVQVRRFNDRAFGGPAAFGHAGRVERGPEFFVAGF